MIGTMALVPQIVDAVRVPVIAAGGIADGRGIAAAFALGASGVQIGTALLGCPEATVSPLYRAQLKAATDDVTELTPAFTGRPVRALRNRFIAEMADTEPLDFPLQVGLVGPLWQLPNESRVPRSCRSGSVRLLRWCATCQRVELVEQLVAEAQPLIGQKRSAR